MTESTKGYAVKARCDTEAAWLWADMHLYKRDAIKSAVKMFCADYDEDEIPKLWRRVKKRWGLKIVKVEMREIEND